MRRALPAALSPGARAPACHMGRCALGLGPGQPDLSGACC
jgi:hypothetical protein